MANLNRERLQRILSIDATWSAYALADLQPDFAPYCEWYVGQSEQGPGVALIFTGLEMPTLFTHGSPAGVMNAVSQIDLPMWVYITIREEHFDYVSTLYDFSRDKRPMWRMTLPVAVEYTLPNNAGLHRLSSGDSDQVRALYAYGGAFSPDAFEPYQVDNGVFYGITNGAGELVASGGTHIVDWQQGIGTIGNMYTRPDARGQGHARTVLRAIVAVLRQGDVTNIVLNVDQRNEAAKQLYEKNGFVIDCPYVEGIGELGR